MYKLFAPRRARRIIKKYDGWIRQVAERYRMPPALLQAVLYKEMTEIDLLDLAADLIVAAGCFPKKDSSTGYAQIFGKTGVESINFAVRRGLTSFEALRLPCSGPLDPRNLSDVRKVWRRLRREPRFNIEVAALTLLSAADEMTGKTCFDSFSEEELKLILTRYNADVRHVTAYGEDAFRLYLSFKANNNRAL